MNSKILNYLIVSSSIFAELSCNGVTKKDDGGAYQKYIRKEGWKDKAGQPCDDHRPAVL